MPYKLKNDKYRKTRGGHSKLLDVRCEHCGAHLFFYQKDGPGILKRTYFDRIIDDNFRPGKQLNCSGCKRLIGIAIIFKKEDRPAFRLFAGSVVKRTANIDKLS